MADVKVMYEILSIAWRCVKNAKDKSDVLSENDFQEMINDAGEKLETIQHTYGMAERYLFSALFHAMSDYIGRKQRNAAQRV